MAKVVKVQLVDGAGHPMAGFKVKLTGCETLDTGAEGTVMFLADDVPGLALEIASSKVWTGTLDELKPMEVFVQTGSGFTRK